LKTIFFNIIKALSVFVKLHYVKLIIAGLSLITAAAIGTTVWSVWFRSPGVLNPDYAAKETEKDAEKIEGGESSDKGESAEGGRLNIVYSHEVTIDLSERKANLLIGNLAKSQHNIVAEIVIQDEIIVQSGAIQPGYRVVGLDIREGAERLLRAGVYKGTIRLYMYDKQTNEREMLSSEIAAEIQVTE
jgi:hypothetical protein